MIVHRIGQDTRIDYDWTDDADQPIVVTSAVLLVDEVTAPTLIEINAAYSVALHITAAYAITAGNHEYKLTAIDAATGDATILSAGLLRVK